MNPAKNQKLCHQHQAWVKVQPALHLLLLTILQLCHFPQLLPPLISNLSCLLTPCQLLYCPTIIFRVSSVQSLSRVWLFATPWIEARQASLSITNSRSLLKLMSIESVMPSSHLILCRPLLLLSPIPPSIRVSPNESTLHTRWPKYWEFHLQHQTFQWTPRTDLL